MDSTNQTSSSSWPGAFGIYNKSKEIVMGNLAVYAILLFGAAAIGFFLGIIPILGDIANLVIQSIAGVALVAVSFAGVRGKKMSFEEAISVGFSKVAVKFFLLSLLMGLIAVGTMILLIVPFFIVFPRIILAPYLLVDQKLGIKESLNKSWELTRGNVGKVWGVIGVSILFAILCIVLVGIYFTLMYAVAFAILTTHLTGGSSAAAAPQGPIAPVAPVPPAAPVS